MENLRGASNRLIVEPYMTKRKEAMINIIAAPTGVGKTYSIMNKLIPYDIKLEYKKFLVLTVYKDNVYQDRNDYQEALAGKAIVTDDIDYFINYRVKNDKLPIVLVSTIAGSACGGQRGGIEDQNRTRIVDMITKNPSSVAVYWDEAHFAGSSNEKTANINTGIPGAWRNYNAAYYKLIEECNLAGAKVTGFTATPLFEQQELLPQFSNGYYHLLTKMSDWPTTSERTEIGSQYRKINMYDISFGSDLAMKLGLIDFYSFSEEFKCRADILNEYDKNIGAMRKPVLLVAASRENTKTGFEMNGAIQSILSFYNGKIDESDFFMGSATQDGYYLYNVRGDVKRVNQIEFFSKIDDDTYPLQIVLFVEKFKFGLNIPRITHEIHMRERNATQDLGYGRVTGPVIQTLGRAVRTWWGIENDDLSSCYVSDAVSYLNQYQGTAIYEVLRQHLLNANSHTFFLPGNVLFEEAIRQWKESYAVSIDISQFNTCTKKLTIGLPFETDNDNDEDACPVCKRPYNQHEELNHDKISTSLGIAA